MMPGMCEHCHDSYFDGLAEEFFKLLHLLFGRSKMKHPLIAELYRFPVVVFASNGKVIGSEEKVSTLHVAQLEIVWQGQ